MRVRHCARRAQRVPRDVLLLRTALGCPREGDVASSGCRLNPTSAARMSAQPDMTHLVCRLNPTTRLSMSAKVGAVPFRWNGKPSQQRPPGTVTPVRKFPRGWKKL